MTTSPSPAFRRFALSRILVWSGAATSLVALPVLVYDLTGSATATAVLAALEAAPYLAFGLVAGAWGDRFDRTRILVSAGLAGALLLASVPVAAHLATLHVAHVLAVALAVGVLGVFADAAAFGSITTLVERGQLAEAQGLLTTVGTLVGVAGPAVGGVLLSRIGAAQVLWIEAAAYVVGAALLRGLHLGGRHRPAGASLLGSIREGLGFVMREPLVRGLTLCGIGVSLAGGGVLGLQVVLAVDVLGVPLDGPQLGLLLAAGACGSAAAGVLAPVVRRRWRAGLVASVGYLAGFAAVAALALSPGWLAAAALLAAWHLVATTVIVNGIVARQALAPDELQSRVNATARMIAWGGQPVGALVAAALVTVVDVRATILLVSTALLASALAAWTSGLHRRAVAPAT
ncbi:MFS transporter [Nocardioides sp. SR21]|uniref:MFS transporter n=1 Tax=Nocardioides sp. SR21 TaxID=2919501 RepID=UPI001FAB0148|nr:MFS transporter [Nocardioides sp. SR21]